MQENSDQKSNKFSDIDDDQERVFNQLRSIWDKKLIDSPKIIKQLHELRLLQIILYSLITSGIIAFFILILIGSHLLIIIIDIGIIVIYLVYLKYFKRKFRKTLKISKRDLKFLIKLNKKSRDLSRIQIIFYSIIIFITITLLIISMIGINPLIMIIIIGVSIIYFYLDKDFEDGNKFIS